jgi:hypothetical protein
MGRSKPSKKNETQENPPAARETYMPKPPSPDDLRTISQEQELLTDEWTGDGPSPSDRSGGKRPAGTKES